MKTNAVPLPGLANQNSSMSLSKLAAGKNPFYSITNWDEDSLRNVTVEVKKTIETTNDYTRKSKPSSRYWSSDVLFKYTDASGKEFSSKVIKMGICDIPYVPSESYGSNYFYANVNAAIVRKIVEAANDSQMNVSEYDKKLSSTEANRWFTINKSQNKVGTLDAKGTMNPRDLHEILVKTEKGVTATVDVIVKLKADDPNGSERSSRTPFHVNFDCSRATIKKRHTYIEPPPLESSVEQAPAQKSDIATDELIGELESLGIA